MGLTEFYGDHVSNFIQFRTQTKNKRPRDKENTWHFTCASGREHTLYLKEDFLNMTPTETFTYL